MNLIQERLTPILYRLVSTKELEQIIKTNKLELVPAIFDEDEYEISNQKLFYKSFARSLDSDFIRNVLKDQTDFHVVIEFDGNKINAQVKGRPVNWAHYNDMEDDEYEDRIFSDRPYLKNARSLIKKIIIIIGHDITPYNLSRLFPALKTATKANIPLVFYLNKNKRLKKLSRAQVEDLYRSFSKARKKTNYKLYRPSSDFFEDAFIVLYSALVDDQLIEYTKKNTHIIDDYLLTFIMAAYDHINNPNDITRSDVLRATDSIWYGAKNYVRENISNDPRTIELLKTMKKMKILNPEKAAKYIWKLLDDHYDEIMKIYDGDL